MRHKLMLVLGLAAMLAAPGTRAEVVHLLDGDRISGRVVSRRKSSLVVRTPYGTLTIPHARIATIVKDDGREEILNAPPRPAATPPPPLRLALIITGQAFWYAWDPPRGARVDPTLRLEVSLDEETVASYTDAAPDPSELSGALVNSFSLQPDAVSLSAGAEARLAPPETRPGRAVLWIELPATAAGRRRLRLAYQINEGSLQEPTWRDCAESALELELQSDAPNFVEVSQSRGDMEFSGLFRRRMKRVETFRIQARPDRNALEPDGPPGP